jgi:CDP-diglyceride synthetase
MTVLSLCLYCIGQATVLIVAANAAPVLTSKLLDRSWAWPVDGGLRLYDGQRLFGDTKTWRGFISAISFSAIVSVAIDIDLFIGMLFGLLAMLGDLLASFIKRRMKCAESGRARGLDTVPESLLPILLLKGPLALGFIDIVATVAVFFLIEEWISPILYRLHIRKRPY